MGEYSWPDCETGEPCLGEWDSGGLRLGEVGIMFCGDEMVLMMSAGLIECGGGGGIPLCSTGSIKNPLPRCCPCFPFKSRGREKPANPAVESAPRNSSENRWFGCGMLRLDSRGEGPAAIPLGTKAGSCPRSLKSLLGKTWWLYGNTRADSSMKGNGTSACGDVDRTSAPNVPVAKAEEFEVAVRFRHEGWS